MSFSKGAVAGLVILTGCTVAPEKPEVSAPQKVEIGLLDVNTEMSAQGTMVSWDNARTEHPLGDQWKYGIEFEFDVNVIQPLYAFLDSDQNFDCNFGATLMGPSYYLTLADGTTMVYDYEKRGQVQNFPGSGSPDFPGLLNAGAHKLTARWFSNEECRMDVAVAVRDRFAPASTFGPAIQRADLLGTWQAGNIVHKYGMDGTLSVTESSQPGESVLEIFDFPYHSRYTARVKAAAEGSAYKAGDVFYCAYDIDTEVSPATMNLSCNEPGDTSIPDPADESDLFTR